MMVQRGDGQLAPLVVADMRPMGTGDILEVLFEGFGDREEVKGFGQCQLFIPLAERVPAAPGEFYPDELAGLTVIDELGPVGVVETFVAEEPSPYLEIATERHGVVMIPFRREFITDIDREKKQVTLRGSVQQHVLP